MVDIYSKCLFFQSGSERGGGAAGGYTMVETCHAIQLNSAYASDSIPPTCSPTDCNFGLVYPSIVFHACIVARVRDKHMTLEACLGVPLLPEAQMVDTGSSIRTP